MPIALFVGTASSVALILTITAWLFQTLSTAVEIPPLAFDLDVRLVHAPALTVRALLHVTESSLQFRRELLDPVVDVHVINS